MHFFLVFKYLLILTPNNINIYIYIIENLLLFYLFIKAQKYPQK